MGQYQVVLTEDANQDLITLANTIKYEYKAPYTAIAYLKGIYNEIKKLSHSAESYKIQNSPTLQKYNPLPRKITYKKMAIIYNVINNVVYIRRILPQNMILDL